MGSLLRRHGYGETQVTPLGKPAASVRSTRLRHLDPPETAMLVGQRVVTGSQLSNREAALALKPKRTLQRVPEDSWRK
jgi:hypothetical protein